MDLNDLITQGERLGLGGAELREWVDVQMKRISDNDRKREKFEREKVTLEKEKMEVQAALEREKDERQLTMLLERQRLAEMSNKNSNGLNDSQSETRVVCKTKGPSPKLPAFDEKNDEFDSYILRFERFAIQQGWETELWASYLSACLKGPALEVYSRLSPEDSQSYDKLKHSLLAKYNLTEEGFRKRFRSQRMKTSETWQEFASRLRHYLDRWIETSDSEDTFCGLKDLILREQLLETCSQDLRVFIKEHKATSAEHVVELATIYAEAHKGRVNHETAKMFAPKCFICDKVGHKAADCRMNSRGKDVKQCSSVNAMKCEYCGKMGHLERWCYQKKRDNRDREPEKKEANERPSNDTFPEKTKTVVNAVTGINQKIVDLNDGSIVPVVSACFNDKSMEYQELLDCYPHSTGNINGFSAVVIRDSACNTVMVRRSLVRDDQFTGQMGLYHVANMKIEKAPWAIIDIDCIYFTGRAYALVVDDVLGDCLLGNIKNAKKPEEVTCAAVTRSMSVKEDEPPELPKSVPMMENVEPDKFKERQRNDDSLAKFWTFCEDGSTERNANFQVKGGFLYRIYVDKDDESIEQLMVPTEFRWKIMHMAHEIPLAGHMGAEKTSKKIKDFFYWPNMNKDILEFCRTCDECQKFEPKGKTKRVPLQEMPLMELPYDRIVIDLIGPITPRSRQGKKYILTIMDCATRYPEAIPLREIDSESVADALMDTFCRMGVPKEILSDNGTQFVSDVMKAVHRILSIKHLTSTLYHPATNGIVERYNGVLKQMLKKVCADNPQDWDKYLPSLLFAYREAPQSSLGFSPFELMFGRDVRGPLQILKELWTRSDLDIDVRTEYEYVINLANKMEKTLETARNELRNSCTKYKQNYDEKSVNRELNEGDLVLLMMPTSHNKLLCHWKGPFEVIKKCGRVNYVIDINGKPKKFHINLLKKYHQRISEGVCGLHSIVVNEEVDGEDNDVIPMVPLLQTESVANVNTSDSLTTTQQQEMEDLMNDFTDVFSDVPGTTNLISFKIEVTDTKPIRTKPYPVPLSLKPTIEKEVGQMMKMDVVELSTSEYCSPVVLVKSPGKSHRFCIDYRKLNAVTKFDSEPIPNVESLFTQVCKGKYLSKYDLTKGYWQIPIEEESRKYTAFATESHFLQFKKLPFGLVCAPAVFTRMMRRLLQGMEHVANYIDDIIIFTETWEEHLKVSGELFKRLSEAGLTVKPSKCYVGFSSLEFLGHRIGGGEISATEKVLDKIQDAKVPQTKKQLRSFLGLTNFYRAYIQDYATLVQPLTELTKKKSRMEEWGSEQDESFKELKDRLSNKPVLKLADLEKEFVVRSDASGVGIGAVLLQEHDDILFPVMYASRKLLPREQAYTATERECLAIVFAVQKFQRYIYGREFIIETDHMALEFLKRTKYSNSRVMRWSLVLQEYQFSVRSVKGSECFGADFLSRIDMD